VDDVDVEPVADHLADPEPTVVVDVEPAAELQPEPEPEPETEPTQDRPDADPLDHEPAAPGLLDLTPTPDAVAEAHAGSAPASATAEVAEVPTEPALVTEPLPDAAPDTSVPLDATTTSTSSTPRRVCSWWPSPSAIRSTTC
jgi:fused signal recognition particle receptor